MDGDVSPINEIVGRIEAIEIRKQCERGSQKNLIFLEEKPQATVKQPQQSIIDQNSEEVK